MTVTQTMLVRSASNPANLSTSYLPTLNGRTSPSGVLAAQEFLVGAAGTIQNLYVVFDVAPDSGKSWAVTVMKNGVATAITCTVSDTNTSNQDTSNTVAVAAGDLVTVRFVPSGTPTTSAVTVLVEWVSDASATSFYGSHRANILAAGSTRYHSPFAPTTSSATDDAGVRTPLPIAGTVTRWEVALSVAPGTGDSYTFTLVKGGVDQDGTGGTPDTRLTIAETETTGSTTFSLSVAAGDVLSAKIVPSGSPTSPTVAQAITFVADQDEVFIWPLAGQGTLSTSAVRYANPRAPGLAWNATESTVQQALIGARTLTAGALAVTTGAFTGGSFAFALRDDAADIATTVTVNGGSTVAVAAGQTGQWAPADLMSVRATPSGTPSLAPAASYTIAFGTISGGGGGGGFNALLIAP